MYSNGVRNFQQYYLLYALRIFIRAQTGALFRKEEIENNPYAERHTCHILVKTEDYKWIFNYLSEQTVHRP